MARIFLSHSSKDREQAARLLQWLHAQGFVSTFLDFDERRGIAPGADWERTLYREVSSADAVILILTKNWFDSKWCFVEFAQARALGKAIFPLVESPTGETFVSSDIQHLNLVKDREGGLERLRSELTRIAINTRGGFPWDGARSPFPGLLAFDEADAAIYFGRDDDIRRLIERLNARRAQGGEKLVTLLGASGSGKSSLLRAGVVPRLRRDQHNWIVLPIFRPQNQPLDELAQAIATGLQDATNWRRWRAALEAEDLLLALSDLARDLRAAYGQNEAHILLVIDQGEELFGEANRKQAEQFTRVLNALLDASSPFLAVMALRSDYLGKLQEASGLTASFEDFPLKPMPLERVREIIEGPARVAGIAVDDALVMAAIADARTDDALPLLAFALRELYDGSAASGRLTVEAYRALGDAKEQLSPLENAVRRRADEVLAKARPVPEDLDALKEAFIPAMVRVNTNGEYARRPADMAALPKQALPLIEKLAKARLLTIRKEQNATLVEVAHEALLRNWPLLRGWLDEERAFIDGKAQLEQDLLLWERAVPQQKSDALLAGLKLTRARLWLLAKPHQLSEGEREFIQASIARQEAEAAQRERVRRSVLSGTIAAAAILAIVAVLALWEWWQANAQRIQADSRQLAVQSMQYSAIDLGASLHEAVNAAATLHTSEAEIALNAALANPHERYILHHAAGVSSAAYSPDGRRIVTASTDWTARVWDAENGSLLLKLLGHKDLVESAVFSPDGKYIVTASDDYTARVWNASDGHSLFTLTGHKGAVNTAYFSPDGKYIVTASDDKTTRVWNASDGHFLFALDGHNGHTDAVKSAVFSPDGGRIITASKDRTARVWDSHGKFLYKLQHAGTVNSAAFSPPDGKLIVTASDDHTAQVWDADNGRLLLPPLAGHTDKVVSAAFSPHGDKIVTASADGSARVWNAGNGRLLATLTGHTNGLYSAGFSHDGTRIVTTAWDMTARVWDASDGRLLATLAGHSGLVVSAEFSPDDQRITTASRDATARVWDTNDDRLQAALAGENGHTGPVDSASFSPDGKRVVTASWDKTARVWDAGGGNLLSTLTGHTDKVNSAAFSPDGSRIVTASSDHTARVWDAGNGHLLLPPLAGHNDNVNSAVFSPDGKRIVTSSADHTARVWDAGDGHLLFPLIGHTDKVVSAVFSPDGKLIVTASDDHTARVWDASDGRLLFTLGGHPDPVDTGVPQTSWAAFSPDSKRIFTATEGEIAKVWDAGSGRLLVTLIGHRREVVAGVFSLDGKRIVTAAWDDTARVWDAASGRLLATLTGSSFGVRSAVFSPDGKHIVTASGDKTARVWEAGSGRLLATLTGHTGAVNSAIFSPDSSHAITASDDGSARVYIVGFEELLARANRLLPVNSPAVERGVIKAP